MFPIHVSPSDHILSLSYILYELECKIKEKERDNKTKFLFQMICDMCSYLPTKTYIVRIKYINSYKDYFNVNSSLKVINVHINILILYLTIDEVISGKFILFQKAFKGDLESLF